MLGHSPPAVGRAEALSGYRSFMNAPSKGRIVTREGGRGMCGSFANVNGYRDKTPPPGGAGKAGERWPQRSIPGTRYRS
jgi:hypothetical protein